MKTDSIEIQEDYPVRIYDNWILRIQNINQLSIQDHTFDCELFVLIHITQKFEKIIYAEMKIRNRIFAGYTINPAMIYLNFKP